MKRKSIISFFKLMGSRLYLKTLPDYDAHIHGYFTDADALAQALEELDDDTTLFFNAQDLSEKYTSKIKHNVFNGAKVGTLLRDTYVSDINYFIIDIDVQSENVSSKDEHGKVLATIEENEGAVNYAKHLAQCLCAEGFHDLGIVNSGNGAYIIVPIKKSKVDVLVKIKTFVGELAKREPRAGYSLDMKVLNASRVFKVPGTLSKKGEPSEENPWRYAKGVQKFSMNNPNDISLIEQYLDKYIKKNNLYIRNSNGYEDWDYDAVCEEAVKEFDCYRDQYNNLYAEQLFDKKRVCYNIEHTETETAIRNWLRRVTDKKCIPLPVMETAKTMLTDEARTGTCYQLAHRIKTEEKEILYDLGDGEKVVRITPTDVTIVARPERTFLADETDDVQVEPDLSVQPNELKELLAPFMNLGSNTNWILFLVFMGAAFVSGFPHPICFISGEKGSCKSTTCRFLQSIVAPKKTGLYTFPREERDLTVTLSKESFLCFDNIGGVKSNIADVLCQSCTGAYVTERKLYTNDEKSTRKLQATLVINGLNLLTNKEDLLDRVLLINLQRLSNTARKTESELEIAFNEVRPKIMGAIFNGLSQMMNVKLHKIKKRIRLADFEECAIKFGIALGYAQEEIESAFDGNSNAITETIIEENPVTYAVLSLLHEKGGLQITATDLWHEIKAKSEDGYNVPKSVSAMSRQLNNCKAELNSKGITFKKDTNGHFKVFVFRNNGKFITNSKYMLDWTAKKELEYKQQRAKVNIQEKIKEVYKKIDEDEEWEESEPLSDEEITVEPEEDLFVEETLEEPEEDLFAEEALEEPEEDLFAEETQEEPEENLFAEETLEESEEDLFAEETLEEPEEDLFAEDLEE